MTLEKNIPGGQKGQASQGIIRRRKQIKPYLYLVPIILFAITFIYYPFFKTFLYSFCVVNARGQITGFAGLENFKYLFGHRNFKTALGNTLKLTAMFVPLNLCFSLGCALLANKKRRLSGVYETMFTLPMAIPMSAVAMIFKILLNPTVGYVNYFLGIQMGWFDDKRYALYGILLVCLWMGLAFDFLLFLSALRGIPDQLLESASLDGAGFFSKLFHIQLPLVMPTVLYVVCTNLVLSMMTSGPVMIITEGGPSRSTTTLIYMMFTSGYQSSDYSLAACISIVTFLLTFGMTALAFVFDSKKTHYD
ncbi:MAG: sugar ABC transporter permease [Lachnospiraceae bacterium]|nr:sugar ABC transporter permease [Lachnospiraceae bacterium]